jgi:hypothetical protein
MREVLVFDQFEAGRVEVGQGVVYDRVKGLEGTRHCRGSLSCQDNVTLSHVFLV